MWMFLGKLNTETNKKVQPYVCELDSWKHRYHMQEKYIEIMRRDNEIMVLRLRYDSSAR